MNNIYDAIKEKENQIAIFQAQISGLNAEIEALRVAARILEGGSARRSGSGTSGGSADTSNGGDKTKRVWP